MKNKLYLLLGALLLISLVSADFRITLTTPSVTFNTNLSEVASYYVGVENKNEFPININILAPTDLLISFEGDTSFELLPNETKDVPFSIKINTTGAYSKDITVSYSGNGSSFSVSEKLLFNIPEIGESSSSTKKSSGSSSTKTTTNTDGTETTEVNITDSLNVNESSGIGDAHITDEILPEEENSISKLILIFAVVLVILVGVFYFMSKEKKEVTEENKEKGGKTKNGKTS